MVMIIKLIIKALILTILACNLQAREPHQILTKFAKNDLRFKKHLLPNEKIPSQKNDLRHSVFLHQVILISFFRDLNVEISISTMNHPYENNTHIKGGELFGDNSIAHVIISVNPEEDFVTSFFLLEKNLIIARRFFERIQAGEISLKTSKENFTKFLINENQTVMKIIKKEFDDSYKNWLINEELEEDALKWIDAEMQNCEKKLEHQINILYEMIPQIIYLGK